MNLWKSALTATTLLASAKAIRAARELEMNDILGPLGLERRRSALDVAIPTIGLLLGGAAIGAGVALFVTPMSGRQLRSQIGRRASDVKERIGELEQRMRRTGNAVGQQTSPEVERY